MSKKPSASKSKTTKAKPAKKAAARKASAASSDADLPPIASQIKLPSGNVLNQLLRSQADLQTEIAEATGSLRQEIAEAVKNHHVHKKALAMIKPLKKLSLQKRGGGKEKLALQMAHFMHYYVATGLKETVDSVLSLNIDGGGEPQADPEMREVEEAGPPTTILPAADDDVSQPRFTH